MKSAPAVLFWLIYTAVTFVAGWKGLSSLVPVKAASSLLIALGFLFTLSGALLTTLFKQYGEQPPKDLGDARKTKMKRLLSRRLNLVWSRYYRSLVASIVSVVCGWALTNDVGPTHHPLIIGLGTAALMHGVLLACLSLYEVRKSAEVAKQLAEELEQRKKRLELLNRLENSGRPPNA